jgi:hypothetical protein
MAAIMSILETVYASAPTAEVVLATLEILVTGVEPIRLVAAYEDLTATLETGQTVTFQAAPFEYKEPAKNTSGQQTLGFAISNVTGDAQKAVEAALESVEEVPVNFRLYLASDLSEPAQTPYKMTLRGGTFEGIMLQVEAGYFDTLNHAWPRKRYVSEFAPGLRYM